MPARAVMRTDMSDPAAKILDLTYLAEAADGDVEFIDEILGDYLVEMARLLSELDDLIAKSETQTLVRNAHTIKGASANVGAGRVRATAAQLEVMANKGTLHPGESLVALLHEEIAEVKALVEREGVERLLQEAS